MVTRNCRYCSVLNANRVEPGLFARASSGGGERPHGRTEVALVQGFTSTWLKPRQIQNSYHRAIPDAALVVVALVAGPGCAHRGMKARALPIPFNHLIGGYARCHATTKCWGLSRYAMPQSDADEALNCQCDIWSVDPIRKPNPRICVWCRAINCSVQWKLEVVQQITPHLEQAVMTFSVQPPLRLNTTRRPRIMPIGFCGRASERATKSGAVIVLSTGRFTTASPRVPETK